MTEEERNRAFLYGLFAAPGVTRVNAGQMLDICRTAEAVFAHGASFAGLIRGEEKREAYLSYMKSADPVGAYEDIRRRGIGFTAMPLPDYPKKLREIPDPPFGLTWIGRLPDEHRSAVAVVGARQCSEYGRIMAARFGEELAAAGVQVISGMAVGIDGISQRGALRSGGESYGILASGVDICYPRENRELYNTLRQRGGVLSENPPGTMPIRQLFPARNRLISAFCDILLVIEARRRSGTFITVDMALEQGRDVFALPGRVTDALSEGCNGLIRQGAGIASSTADILDALRGRGPGKEITGKETKEQRTEAVCQSLSRTIALTDEEAMAAACLDVVPRSMDEIADRLRACGKPMELPVLMESLVDLCMKGAAREEGGRFLKRLAV